MEMLSWVEMRGIAEEVDINMEKVALMANEVMDGFLNKYRINPKASAERMINSVGRYANFMDIMFDYFYQMKSGFDVLNKNIREWAEKERRLDEREKGKAVQI